MHTAPPRALPPPVPPAPSPGLMPPTMHHIH